MTKTIQTTFIIFLYSLSLTTLSYADNISDINRTQSFNDITNTKVTDLNSKSNNITNANMISSNQDLGNDNNDPKNSIKPKKKDYKFAVSLNGFLDLHYTGGGIDFSFPIYRKGLFEIRNFIGIVGQGNMDSEGFGGISEKISFGFPIKSSKYPVTPYSFMFFDIGYGGERRISTGAFRSLVSYTVGGGAGVNISVLEYSTYFVEIGGYSTVKVWGDNVDSHASGRISTGFRYMF